MGIKEVSIRTYLVSFRYGHADAGCLGLVEEKLQYNHQAGKGWTLLRGVLAAAADLQTVVIRLCMCKALVESLNSSNILANPLKVARKETAFIHSSGAPKQSAALGIMEHA